MRNGILCLTLACSLTLGLAAEPYQEEIESWHQARIEKLTGDDGWLTLVGLHWLTEKKQTFPHVGEAYLEGKDVILRPPGKEQLVALSPEQPEGQPTFHKGSVSFYVIRRGPWIGLRVKDNEAALRRDFPGIKRFGVDPKWRLQGQLEADPQQLNVASVVGVATKEHSPGWARFQWDGQAHRVRLLGKPEAKSFFLVFSDATAGKSTYSACRFLSVERGPSGKLTLDFNKAVNPPCAFTHYATCPLPLKENLLPFEVTAGEKTFEH